MKALKFKELICHHFLSHEHTVLKLDDRGLLLIAGANGAGKSALLPDGVCYALYGRTLRGIRGKDVVNDKFGSDCYVQLDMATEDGVSVAICRPQLNESEPKPWVRVGEDTIYGAEEVDRMVESLLGVGFEAFVAALVFGKGNTRFFTELPDTARKAILDELLSLADVNTCAEVVKTDEKALVSEIGDIEKDIVATDATIKANQENLERFGKDAIEFEDAKIRGLAEAGKRYDECKAEYVAVVKEIEILGKSDVPPTEAMRAKLGDLSKKHKRAADLLQACVAEITFLKKEEAQHEGLLTRAEQSKTVCEICMRPMEGEMRQQILEAHNQSLSYDRLALKQQLERRGEIEGVLRGLEDLEKKAEAERYEAENFVAAQEARKKALTEQAESLFSRLGAQKDAIKNLQDSRNNAQELLEATERKIADLKNNRSILNEKLEEYAHRQDVVMFWKKGFSNTGIKSWMIDNIIPFLNERARYYSEALTDGTIEVQFSTQTETKTGKVTDKFDVGVSAKNGGGSYQACSDGQRRRADIITTMALGDLAASRVSRSINIAILDEIFDGLDAEGMDRAVQLLKLLASRRSSVFCITHDEDMQGYFPQVLRIVNEEGRSNVEGA